MLQPALLGGRPAFGTRVPLAEPTLPLSDVLAEELRAVLDSKMLTNGSWVATLERVAAEYLDVNHVVAVSSCSVGLILVLKCLGLTGEVIMPSFTFCATGHAALWNGLEPVFCDCEPDTMNIDPGHAASLVGPRTAAIMGVHVFGAPCNLDDLGLLATRHSLPLVIDAAHAFGSRVAGAPVGAQGAAQVYSLSPTKVLVAGEGGLIATNDGTLAAQLRTARNYGHDGDYDCQMAGINGRLAEINALLAAAGLRYLESNLARRLRLVSEYRAGLADIPGIGFQSVRECDRSTYKDFTITVCPSEFGLDRDQLAAYLDSEGVASRRYFYPPLHEQRVYKDRLRSVRPSLPATERVSRQVLTLPLYSHMPRETVDMICDLIRAAHANRRALARVIRSGRSQGGSSVGVSAAVSAV